MTLDLSTLLIGASRDSHAVTRFARLLLAWMIGVSACIAAAVSSSSPATMFFRFGPHHDFVVLGVRIDTPARYVAISLYCFINCILRSVHHNVITTWIISNVHDETCDKSHLRPAAVYEVVAASTLYAWWDWVVYIFILLSQIDMVLIEVAAELSVAAVTTCAFLRTPWLPVSNGSQGEERLLP